MATPIAEHSEPLSGSFRDPSGLVYRRDGVLYRQINASYRDYFEALITSGLYDSLVSKGQLIEHEDADLGLRHSDDAWRVIRPRTVPFISYPYEWSFGQLKDAAILTLRIQREALDRKMSLKDASAYNVQFVGCSPVFIDTLSFEPYVEGRPWVAYRQFCQHFLAPLALMSLVDVRLGQLLRTYLDGVPLDLASRLLPWSSRLKFPLLTHLHLHAKSQARYADKPVRGSSMKVSRLSIIGLLDSLRKAIEGMDWTPAGTAWGDYYEKTNYEPEAMGRKSELVSRFVERVNPSTVWDLGANTGAFSRLASRRGAMTVAFDIDPAAVEKNYREGVRERDRNLLPLQLDATNPSPGLGWENSERDTLAQRGPVDTLLALALVHHLAIGNNVPLERIARYFSKLGRWLVIEFVPKEDSQVQRLLASREDIFAGYTAEAFESAFRRHYMIDGIEPIEGTHRTLYLMRASDGEGN